MGGGRQARGGVQFVIEAWVWGRKKNFLQKEPVKYSVELLSLKQIETTMISFYTLRKGTI